MVLPKPGAWVVLFVVIAVVAIAGARTPSPCPRNATAAAKSCRSGCRAPYRFDRAACVPREGECVASCKVHLDGCRGVGFNAEELLFCAQDFETTRVDCLTRFSDDASGPFLDCVEQGRRAAKRCRAGALKFD